jgi:hypothetical protein
MSRSHRPVAAALAAVACLALPAGALASSPKKSPPNLSCEITPTQLFYSGTYNNVTVPPGQTCELSNATVRGNVTVQMAGSVTFENSGTVGGSLLVGQLGGASEDTGWVIDGGALANQAAGLTFQGTVHGILANDTDTLALGSATVDGSVVSNRGVFGGAVTSSVITGDLVINGTASTDPSIDSTWLIAGPQLDGSPQQIDGNVILTNNQSTIFLFENHIKKNLVCQGNNPPPFNSFDGFTNTVDGRSTGQCATTNPVTGAQASAAKARAARALR